MSQDILNQVAYEILVSKAKISIQLDESTDVSNCTYLLVYCRYVHAGELKEKFLMCESLETTTKAVNVLEKMDRFFQQNNISWNHVGSICTDGAPSMLDTKSGFGEKNAHRTSYLFIVHFIDKHWQVKPFQNT